MDNTGLTRNQIIILVVLGVATCALIGFGGYLVYITSLVPATEIPSPVPGDTGMPAPTVTATPAATDTPNPEDVDPAWARIQESGTLVVGTSADYPPFEYYNSQYQLDGFDMALIREIATRLGLEVQIKDIVFDNLFSAIMFEQIDMAIAAISLTPERQSMVYFSHVYLISHDGILAQESSDLQQVSNIQELAPLRVGVQLRSVYEKILREELVFEGLMPGTNLRVYPQVDTAVADLKMGLLDVVVMDLLPAQQALTLGGLKIVGQGLSIQNYAIAMPHGASILQAEINTVLQEMYDEGRISELSQQHLGISSDRLPPQPTALPPQPTATPPAGCINGMEFVRDLTYPDYAMTNPPIIPPGTPFQKGWRIRNIGTCTWDSSFNLSYIGGNAPASGMGGQPVNIAGTVAPGAEYDIYVNLVSPLLPGVYQGFWQMHNGASQPFGERLWVGISVPPANPSTPTPAPGAPLIHRFDVIPSDQINLGACVQVVWDVRGDVTKVSLSRNDGVVRDDVPVQGWVQDCPSSSGEIVYRIEAVGPGGISRAAEDVLVTETTEPTPPPEETPTPIPPMPPAIISFEVEPPEIQSGQCFLVSWNVDGDADLIQIRRNEHIILGDAPDRGRGEDCPQDAGSYIYRIDASNDAGQSDFSEKTVTVGLNPNLPDPGLMRSWKLAFYSNLEGVFVPILAGTEITAIFNSDGSLDGSAGCNSYNTSYQAAGEKIQIEPATFTQKVCSDPEGVMEQETSYLAALIAADSYQVSGDQLDIFDSEGGKILTFVVQ